MRVVRGRWLIGASLVVLMTSAACGSDDESADSSDTREAAETPVQEAASELGEVHWSYEGETGPANWAMLAAEFATCAEGREQSPIDIKTADVRVADLALPILDWRAGDVEVVNNGHTIQINVPEGNTSEFDGNSYRLIQFHWHRPSEHKVDGQSFAMELHFVHAAESGELAVLGVLIEEGAGDALYDVLFAEQPREGEIRTFTNFDALRLLPNDLSAYAYSGSLTTPPCSEGVSWYVLQERRSISAEQAERFLFDGNARPVQPLNDRQVRVSED